LITRQSFQYNHVVVMHSPSASYPVYPVKSKQTGRGKNSTEHSIQPNSTARHPAQPQACECFSIAATQVRIAHPKHPTDANGARRICHITGSFRHDDDFRDRHHLQQ
jgi:hypothetical protein